MGRGLYGALIVDEPTPPPVDHDLLLVIADWRLDASGQIVGDFDNPADALRQGRFGAEISVNSKAAPLMQEFLPGARLRLRLVNAANARIMAIAFDGAAPQIFAIDGQFCRLFEPVRRTLPIGPGARFEVMLDLPATEGSDVALILRGETELPDRRIVVFRTKGQRAPQRPAPVTPPENPRLPAEIQLQNAKKLELVIDGGAPAHPAAGSAPPRGEAPRRIWTINGRASNGADGPPLFTVKRGTAVSLGFTNKSLYPIDMHVHGHVMRLLHDLDDGWDPYWRDSVIVPELRTKHVAFIADNPGKWMIHCAIYEHLSNGLAAWFEVT